MSQITNEVKNQIKKKVQKKNIEQDLDPNFWSLTTMNQAGI